MPVMRAAASRLRKIVRGLSGVLQAAEGAPEKCDRPANGMNRATNTSSYLRMDAGRDEEKRDPAQAHRAEIQCGQPPRSQGWWRTVRRPCSFNYRNACRRR